MLGENKKKNYIYFIKKKIITNEELLVVSRGQKGLFLLACECRSPISQDPVDSTQQVKNMLFLQNDDNK